MHLLALIALNALLAACGDEREVYLPVPIGDSPREGAADAWLTVVEFSDFECKYCLRAQPTLRELQAQYGADLRRVFKHFPLPAHTRAIPAALAAECMGLFGAFWAMEAAIFNYHALDDGGLRYFAEYLLAPEQVPAWDACLSTDAPRTRIEADLEMGQSLGVEGTPTLFVNGRKLAGLYSPDEYREVFDEELAKAKQSGVPRERYYEDVVLSYPAPKR